MFVQDVLVYIGSEDWLGPSDNKLSLDLISI